MNRLPEHDEIVSAFGIESPCGHTALLTWLEVEHIDAPLSLSAEKDPLAPLDALCDTVGTLQFQLVSNTLAAVWK
jgi:hypothetical protein